MIYWRESVRLLIYIIVLSSFIGCGSSRKSDRDIRREQIKVNADSKRRELSPVAGEYFGLVGEKDHLKQNISLTLAVKDVPYNQDEEIDSVLIPSLTGALKIVFSQNIAEASASNSFNFSIVKGEYSSSSVSLHLVAEHSIYKEVILDLSFEDDTYGELRGSWNVPSLSIGGEITLAKVTSENRISLVDSFHSSKVDGTYRGITYWDQIKQYQHADLTLTSVSLPPDGFKLSASTRLYFGKKEDKEYLSYKFETIEFNPFTGFFTMKSSDSEVLFQGNLSNGQVEGDWSSEYTGRLGAFDFVRESRKVTPNPKYSAMQPLGGSYQGNLAVTHSEANFPERILISITSREDSSTQGAAAFSGNLRFYLGPFDSIEYYEMPLTDIEFNAYTRIFNAKTTGDYNLTIKAKIQGGQLNGTLYSDALGKVGEISTQRQQ